MPALISRMIRHKSAIRILGNKRMPRIIEHYSGWFKGGLVNKIIAKTVLIFDFARDVVPNFPTTKRNDLVFFDRCFVC